MREVRPPTAIAGVAGGYPASFPYDPDEAYPEYRGGRVAATPNPVYRAVRESFRLLGLDADRFGTRDWNPLGAIVKPGNRVFLKPNLVTHEYRRSCPRAGDLYACITHPSVVRAVADYAALALGGKGELVVGDNPSIDADFAKLLATTRLGELKNLYWDRFRTVCRVLDLRPRWTADLRHYGLKSRTSALPGDPEGEAVLDLGNASLLAGLDPRGFRGVFTDRRETIARHSNGRHEYSISRTILNSDVYISIPKLKTHHKVGATLNIKGLVGINSNKNYLVHWRVGYPQSGGDEYPRAHGPRDRALLALRQAVTDNTPECLQAHIGGHLRGSWIDRCTTPVRRRSYESFRGAWAGNDTCWRMAADLYRLFVQDAAGWRIKHARTTRFLSVVDGVIGGEGEGPFCPDARAARVVVAGSDLLAVDTVAARLMDLRVEAIPYLERLLADEETQLSDLPVRYDAAPAGSFFAPGARYLRFRPPSGWPHLAQQPKGKEGEHATDHSGSWPGRAADATHPQHAEATVGSR